MEARPEKRSWFQLHLSTLFFVPLVAYGLFFLNSVGWFAGYEGGRGWPFRITRDFADFRVTASYNTQLLVGGLLADISFAWLTICATFLICERTRCLRKAETWFRLAIRYLVTVCTPKRHWFRFHLMTAVILMIVASGLIYLQLQPTHGQTNWRIQIDRDLYGWPSHAYCAYNYDRYAGMEEVYVPDDPTPYTIDQLKEPNDLSYSDLIWDAGVCLLILLFTAFLCECWICKDLKPQPLTIHELSKT